MDISPSFPDNFLSPGPLRTGLEIFAQKTTNNEHKQRRNPNKLGVNNKTTNTDIEFKQDGIHLFISLHHGGIPPDSSTAAVDIHVRLSDHNGG